MQNVSTLIFGLNGTISDPSLGIGRCLNYSLTEHGYPAVSKEKVAAAIGPPLDETFRKYSPEKRSDVIVSLVAKYRERYAEAGYSENQIYPGIAEEFRLLTTNGIRMGICTSKRNDFAETILDMHGLHTLSSFVDGGDVGISKREQLTG